MTTFHIRISSADKLIFDGEAIHCRVWTTKGALGLEARHEPILVTLAPDSVIDVRVPDGNVKTFQVAEGLLRFDDNACAISVRETVES